MDNEQTNHPTHFFLKKKICELLYFTNMHFSHLLILKLASSMDPTAFHYL